MTRLNILEYPDPRLRTRAAPVTAFDAGLSRLIDDLFETLYASRAIGLAATQVGAHQRVIVIDVSAERTAPQLFINPQVVAREAPGIVEESCLSLPGVIANVRRATRVRVRSHDRAGVVRVHALEDIAAVCVQHEMDHLEGILFVDHLSFFARRRIYRQMRRSARSLPAAVAASGS
jgi:peptide deformylase